MCLLLQKSSRRVGVRLEISAPQLIVPRDLCDPDTQMVVFDLGRLRVTNLTSGLVEDDLPKFSGVRTNALGEEIEVDGVDDGMVHLVISYMI